MTDSACTDLGPADSSLTHGIMTGVVLSCLSLFVWSDHSHSGPSLSDLPPSSMTITSDWDDLAGAASLSFLETSKEAGPPMLHGIVSELSGLLSPVPTSLPVRSRRQMWVLSLLPSVSAVLPTTKVTMSDPLTSVTLQRPVGLPLLVFIEVMGSNVPVSALLLLPMEASAAISWLALPVAPSTLTISSSPFSSDSAD